MRDSSGTSSELRAVEQHETESAPRARFKRRCLIQAAREASSEPRAAGGAEPRAAGGAEQRAAGGAERHETESAPACAIPSDDA